jgi:hypothetical protein
MKKIIIIRSKIITKNTIFWDMAPNKRTFWFCLLPAFTPACSTYYTLMMEAICSIERSDEFQQTTRSHTPQDSDITTAVPTSNSYFHTNLSFGVLPFQRILPYCNIRLEVPFLGSKKIICTRLSYAVNICLRLLD